MVLSFLHLLYRFQDRIVYVLNFIYSVRQMVMNKQDWYSKFILVALHLPRILCTGIFMTDKKFLYFRQIYDNIGYLSGSCLLHLPV